MNKICGIYKILNIINNKIYIGSSKELYTRIKRHKYQLKNNIHGNFHLQNAWNKYGEKSFIFEIIKKCELDNLINLEEYYINKYKSNNRKFGYNIESFICGRKEMSSNTKSKISKTKLKANLSSPMKGKTHSLEAREKIRLANLGRKFTKEHKQKIVNGRKNSKKIVTRKIEQLDLNNNHIKYWNSITEASNNLNILITSITNCCSNRSKTAGGFIWKYQV